MSVTGNNLNGHINDHMDHVEFHFHNKERWFGISGDQSGNDWAADTLNNYQAISGNGVYGADANDEAKVIGTDDMPAISGKTKFDMREILIEGLSVDTVFKLRIVWGTGTMADAITAGQFTEVIVQNGTAGNFGNGAPLQVTIPRLSSGSDKVWLQCKCATDNATCDFFVGVHEYVR